MEIKKCKCGKASMKYEVIGEDLWSGIPENTDLVKSGYVFECHCQYCGESYDSYDPFMVKIFE